MTDILSLPMKDNDAGAKTVGEYLSRLLIELWKYDEEFSGKRPFGNSGWKYEVYSALADAGIIEAEKDVWDEEDEEHGWEWTWSYEQQSTADKMIQQAIKELFA